MSDKKITAMSPDALRSSPPGGGLIRLLSALVFIAPFVFGSARISYATFTTVASVRSSAAE
jgi:hypothetical protein